MDYYSDKLDELSLQQAYEDTDYFILDPEIHFKHGRRNDILDKYLSTIGKKTWIFISAANPRSIIQADDINRWQNINLEFDLTAKSLAYVYAKGKSNDHNWPEEESFLVFDMEISEALALAKLYDQNAILIGQLGHKAQLVWT